MTSRFSVHNTPLAGLWLLQRKPISDARGYLERLFCAGELQSLVPGKQIVQINHTLTATYGTVRGMHFQLPPYAETKFISCIHGEVFDVAVDLRQESPTFLHWHAETLSADNHKTMVIPEGFAHGFQSLKDNCELLYFHTASYDPKVEAGIHPEDPRVGVNWPLPVCNLSARDAGHPALTEEFTGLAI